MNQITAPPNRWRPLNALVRISRTRAWNSALTDFRIHVDQSEVGRVSNGDTVEIPIPSGGCAIHISAPSLLLSIQTPVLALDVAPGGVALLETGTAAKELVDWLVPEVSMMRAVMNEYLYLRRTA